MEYDEKVRLRNNLRKRYKFENLKWTPLKNRQRKRKIWILQKKREEKSKPDSSNNVRISGED